MNEWRDAALDAGYRGEEADQAARMLEEQERERYERREEDRRASGLPPICERCGAPVIVYDALVDRMVQHDCWPHKTVSSADQADGVANESHSDD